MAEQKQWLSAALLCGQGPLTPSVRQEPEHDQFSHILPASCREVATIKSLQQETVCSFGWACVALAASAAAAAAAAPPPLLLLLHLLLLWLWVEVFAQELQ